MPEINLLKNELRDRSPLRFLPRGLVSFYIVLAVLGVEILGFGILAAVQKNLQNKAQEQERRMADIDLAVSRNEKDRTAAISFQGRLNNVQVLMQNHIYWTAVLNELSKYTLKSVIFSSLSTSFIDNKISIAGLAPTYTDLAKLLLGLKQSQSITDVTLKSSGASGVERGGYKFTLEVRFDPKLLLK